MHVKQAYVDQLVTELVLSNSVCNHTQDKRNWTPAVWLSHFVITCMITNQIGLHSVL